MPDKPRYDGVSLDVALDNIATAFDLDTDELIEYAALDPWGGYHAEKDDGFPIGSMWRVEGNVIYALVRALKPARVLETGTSRGCSATHILQALWDNGRDGFLDCVDNGYQVAIPGDMIPAKFKDLYQIHKRDMMEFLDEVPDHTYDFYLEDALHNTDQVEKAWRSAYRILRPGGMMLSHDAEHFIVGERVRAGIAQAGYFGLPNPARTVLIAPSDCGFGYWRKPLEVESVPEKPKRGRKAKNAK